MAYINQKTAGSMDGFVRLGGGYYSVQCSDGQARLSHRECARLYVYVDGLKK